jgi:spermidine synthase
MKKRFSLAILVMGFSGLVAQILLLRELLIVFSGNELCIGIILANWLILEAFGSYVLGRRAEISKYKLETFTVITIIFSLSLLIAIYQTRILKGVIGISIGESTGFITMFYSSFLVLFAVNVLLLVSCPFCCKHTSRCIIYIQLPDLFPVFQPGCIFCWQGLCV